MVGELVEKLLKNLESIVESETVIGEPVQAGETTIIPLTKIALGFGAGGGEKDDQKQTASGTGGGANIEPVAVIVVKGDDVTIKNLKETKANYSKLLDMLPKIVNKFTKEKGGQKKGKKEVENESG